MNIKKIYNILANKAYVKFCHKEWISINKILRQPPIQVEYQLIAAIRWVALECLDGHNDFGMTLYCRTSEQSKEKAIERIESLKKSLSEKGFDPKYPIPVDKDYNLSNGRHRLVLSAYLGLNEICVVKAPRHFRLPPLEGIVKNLKITKEEMLLLEDAYMRLYNSIKK